MGGRHNLRQDLGGMALPLVRVGHLLPKDRRMVHGEPPQDGVGSGCVEHGYLHSPALARADSSPDRGSQYTSVEFSSRLSEEGLLPSMGSVADAYELDG